jgi:hypothetical protein
MQKLICTDDPPIDIYIEDIEREYLLSQDILSLLLEEEDKRYYEEQSYYFSLQEVGMC